MPTWLQIILSVFASVMASSGFWAFLLSRKEKKERAKEKEEDKKSATNRMLIGLGHDRIINLCIKYIERTWISKDEYEDLMKYLYEPYIELGGNGTAKRLIEEVKKLPIKELTYSEQIKGAKK